MYCPNCGNKCQQSHHFCYKCGTALPEEAILSDEETVISTNPEEPVQAEVSVTLDETTVEEHTPEPESAPEPQPYLQESPAVPEQPKPKQGRIWPPMLLLALMICGGLSLFFFGQQPPKPETKAFFTAENGILSFHPEYYTGSGELTIPSTVDGQTVTAIADYAFQNCDSITTVILPETVTQIGKYAFSDCDNLRGLYIPETVTAIDKYAFLNCSCLEAIYLPSSLKILGNGALDACNSLKFILFNGTYARWNELYSGNFSSGVELHTTDGTYYAQP